MAESKPAGPAQSDPSGRRRVGPNSLKAFAHPLRMAMFGELQRRGAATASQLARSLGESSGQTSYHLRQLERHGFVEDDPEHPGGRERWWRPVGFEMTDPALLLDPATQDSARAIIHQLVAERTSELAGWLNRMDPAQSATLGLLASASLSLTEAETEALCTELAEVLDRHSRAVRDRRPPDDARRIRVYLDVFPLEPDTSD